MATRLNASSDGAPLGEVIAAYLQALERGETPDRFALIAAHPELAAELADYFADLDRMNRMAAPLMLSDPNQTSGFADEAAVSLPVVKYFGDYELEAEIARGGMGVVFKARQKSLNRVVALKMILTGQLASSADVQRFRAEAEAAANLDHANILPIYEVGEHEGRQYFTMKLIEGGSLAGRAKSLLPDSYAGAKLVATLARAIHFAHQRGILHRDLKPANVLIDSDGTPYVTDFGLAKKTGSDSGLTHTGAVVGTPSYMASEQARGEKGLTVAADVYSLGAILFELLTGRPPFRGATVYETIKAVIEQEPAHPRTLNAKADSDLAAIALKCLAKAPESRYSSADELAADLERWLAGEPTKARPPSLASLAWRWLKRNAVATATVAGVGIVWGLLTGLLMYVADTDSHASRPVGILLTGAESWFNPIGWAYRARDLSVARWGTIAGVAIFWLSVGWWLRAGVRPRSPAIALGAGATAGLLAAWVCNLFLAPSFATDLKIQLYPLRTEERPIWRINPDGTQFRITQPDIDIPHRDLIYLEQFLPPEKRDPTRRENANAYSEAHRNLLAVNQYHRAVAGIWLSQFVTLLFFFSVAVVSAWAADYLVRSGRGPVACAFCYAELHLSALAMLIALTLTMVLVMIISSSDVRGGPPVAPFAAASAGAVVLTICAYLGVLRGWHPAIRIMGYILCLALVFAVFWVHI